MLPPSMHTKKASMEQQVQPIHRGFLLWKIPLF